MSLMARPDTARRGPKPHKDAWPCSCHCHVLPEGTVMHCKPCCDNGWRKPLFSELIYVDKQADLERKG